MPPEYKVRADLPWSAQSQMSGHGRTGDPIAMQNTKAAASASARTSDDIRVQQAFLARVLGEIETEVGDGKDRRLAIRHAAAKLAEARLDWNGMAAAALRD